MLTELQIDNFKSFGSEMRPLALRPLNFIVGANTSGKTNLLSALRFFENRLVVKRGNCSRRIRGGRRSSQ